MFLMNLLFNFLINPHSGRIGFSNRSFYLFTKVNCQVFKICQIVNGKRYFGEWFFMIKFVLKNLTRNDSGYKN